MSAHGLTVSRTAAVRTPVCLIEAPEGPGASQRPRPNIFLRLNLERNLTVLLVTHQHDIADDGTRIVSFRDGPDRRRSPSNRAPLGHARAHAGAGRSDRELVTA